MGFYNLFLFKQNYENGQVNSIYGSFPGGLNEMVILGQEIGSNPRTLVLIHATRIVVVVFLSLY